MLKRIKLDNGQEVVISESLLTKEEIEQIDKELAVKDNNILNIIFYACVAILIVTFSLFIFVSQNYVYIVIPVSICIVVVDVVIERMYKFRRYLK